MIRLSAQGRGLCKLGVAVLAIWLLIWVITPFWVSLSPLHQRFADVQEKYDVPIGALYYNDLPFINDAAMMLNDTWRYLPHGVLQHKK